MWKYIFLKKHISLLIWDLMIFQIEGMSKIITEKTQHPK